MPRLTPLKSKTAYGLEHGDRVRYVGDGTSVAQGAYGSVRTLYDDEQVEVAFDEGTTLITKASAVEKVTGFGWTGFGMYT